MQTRIVVACLAPFILAAGRAAELPAADRQLAREVLAELVNINTSSAGAGTTRAAAAIVARLRAAGYAAKEIELVGPDPQNQNLVVRLRGRAPGKPILLLAHLDTVTANREDWSVDPFVFTERDGWWYGRGIRDNKGGVATLVTNLLRWKRDGFEPARNLVVLLTAYEETDAEKGGIGWLAEHRRDLLDAAFCLNTDSGRGVLKDGKPLLMSLQAAEKVYQSFRLEVTNPGGHSSLPRPDNAIIQLARALVRLSEFQFPVQLTDITRAYFAELARLETGGAADDMRGLVAAEPDAAAAARLSTASPLYNAMLHTTCIATMIEGGHAENALPQRARATVNCRMLPGHDPAQVLATIRKAVDDSSISVKSLLPARPSPASPLRPDIVGPIARVVKETWGVPLVPVMETGGTDGLYVRNAGVPTYAVSGIFEDPADIRAHGRDERLDPEQYYGAVGFWDAMLRALAQ